MKTQYILSFILLFVFALASCQQNEATTNDQDAQQTETIVEAPGSDDSPARSDIKIVEPSGENMGVASLPNGVEIEIPAGSMEEKLIKALSSKEDLAEERFIMDGLSFGGDHVTLSEESHFQLYNFRQIVEAFPEKNWMILSYYFDEETPDKNQEISDNQLDAIQRFLGDNGTDLGSIEWVAFGSSNPGDGGDGEQADQSRVVLQMH